jgi:hypothetical protein
MRGRYTVVLVGSIGRIALAAAIALGASACRDKSCIDGECPVPCAAIQLTCSEQPVFYQGTLGAAPANLMLVGGNAGANDIMISNGRVTAVISAVDTPNDLAPTGGNLVDFGVPAGVDDVTLTYQIAGILPDDAFAYRTLEHAQTADGVSVTVRGTLDGRPDVKVVTHYELRACDPGVRMRTELFNGSFDKQAFVIADAMHWGKRRQVPFVPAKGQGYSQPELDLLELSALWAPYDYATAATPSANAPAYGTVGCSREQLSGVNDLEIAALGTPMEYVEPGDSLVLERMLVATGQGNGTAPAIDAIVDARAQLFDESPVTVKGRIIVGTGHVTIPFGGDVRRASVIVSSNGRPVSSLVPAADGTFVARVPAGTIDIEVWSFGHLASKQAGSVDANGVVDLGDVFVPEPATAQLSVRRNRVNGPTEDAWAIVVFTQPGAEPGTFHGRLTGCTPWLGPPNGPSPACNQAIVSPQGTELEVPAGRYVVYATTGPENTLARQEVTLNAGEVTPISFDVTELQIAPPGWLATDLHVHGRASFDSGIPDDDRVRTFVASGVKVIAATDHDVIGDYTQTVAVLGLDDRVAVMGGLETTQLIPWMDIPGEDLPRVIGHFNFWPLTRMPSEPRAGAPWDELIEPGQLFDRMQPLVGDGGMMMLNHPWGDPLFGRDTGYLRAIKFDPRKRVEDQPTLTKRPGGLHRNMDWTIIEIINGSDVSEMAQSRVLWHSLLAQGFVVPGAGNSDSHGMTDEHLGWARNWVEAPTQVAGFSADKLNAAIRDGHMIAGNGVVVLVEVGPPSGQRRGLGFAPYHPNAGDVLAITIKAAPWIPVDEVRVVTSRGTKVIATGLSKPADPFGTDGVVRYSAELPLADLVEHDDFIVVEAGLAYPISADLNDDGVPDTTDNNRDGIVDDSDIDPDEDVGPFVGPPDPTDPADPLYVFTRIVPTGWPEGFANPIFIDKDGDGVWTPPGLP